jgi:hypothetical protein
LSFLPENHLPSIIRKRSILKRSEIPLQLEILMKLYQFKEIAIEGTPLRRASLAPATVPE